MQPSNLDHFPPKYPGETSKKYVMFHHLLGIGILQEVQVTSWNLCFHCHAPNVWHFHSTNRKVKGFKLESLQGFFYPHWKTWHPKRIFTAYLQKQEWKHYQLNWNYESAILLSHFFSSQLAISVLFFQNGSLHLLAYAMSSRYEVWSRQTSFFTTWLQLVPLLEPQTGDF